MTYKTLTFLLALILLTNPMISQSQNADTSIAKSESPEFWMTGAEVKPNYPITRDTLNIFPETVTITGKVADYSSGLSCRLVCGCGTLKIEISKKDSAYRSDEIYVAVPCLNGLPKKFKNMRKWTLYKIPTNSKACYWTDSSINKFDTKGLAFYSLTKFHTAD